MTDEMTAIKPRAVWPKPNTVPGPGLDPEATPQELHDQLIDVGRDLMESEQLRGDIEVKFYRLRSAVDQVLRGELTLAGLASARKGMG